MQIPTRLSMEVLSVIVTVLYIIDEMGVRYHNRKLVGCKFLTPVIDKCKNKNKTEALDTFLNKIRCKYDF